MGYYENLNSNWHSGVPPNIRNYAAATQSGTNPTGLFGASYDAPSYVPSWKSEYASLPYLQGQIGPAQASVAALRGEAMRPAGTASPWAKLSTKSQYAQAAQAKNRLARDLAGSQATASSQLAMRGGLTGGARERLAQSGSRGFMEMGQDVGRQTRENLFNIQLQDEQSRQRQLAALPEQELMIPKLLTGARGGDVGQQIDEVGRQNLFNMNAFNQRMRVLSAQRIADAQRWEAED